MHKQALLTLLIVTATLGATHDAWAQTSPDPTPPSPAVSIAPVPEPPPPPPPPPEQSGQTSGLGTDIKEYFTSPLRWDGGDWAWFGGALVAIAASHHYDSQVRTHFVKNLAPGQTLPSDDVQDFIPTAAVLVLTWAYANFTDDSRGRQEAWAMFEAAGLSTVTAYGLKYSLRRLGPDQTDDPDAWEKPGGRSFPSEHATAAFAVGTVLAESGSDEYRWLRRLLGYGLGVGTSYLRLKHNTHWLSDTVAGAALGISSAHFAMNHTYKTGQQGSNLSVVPIEGGAMLTYTLRLP